MVTAQQPEGTTPLDPDEVGGLIPAHIATQGPLNAWEQANILEGARSGGEARLALDAHGPRPQPGDGRDPFERFASGHSQPVTARAALYLDTSAILRALLESGTTPEIEQKIATATVLLTSRLSQVEAARALWRIRALHTVAEAKLADARRDLNELWRRCDIWELSPAVCRLASEVAPAQSLRPLDALHLATYVLARERIAGLELLTADERLHDAVGL